MNRKIALLISSLFHPVFVNLLTLLSLFVLFPQLQYVMSSTLKTFYILFIFITTGLLPIAVVSILRLFGKTSSLLLNDKEERNIPYIIIACIYLFDYYFCVRIASPALINVYLLGSASIVVAVLIINRFDKISIHGTSMGALTAIIISAVHTAGFDTRILLAFVILCSGLTLSARLFSNAHSTYQLYTGFFLGLFLMLFIL